MTASFPPGYCRYCGATSPSWYTRCQRCQRALASPGRATPADPTGATDPLAGLAGGRIGFVGPIGAMLGRGGVLWFALGIVGFVLGVFFLIGASLLALVFGLTGPGCATDPICLATPAVHWTVVTVGVLFLLLGVAGIAFSVRRSMMRGPSLTLPP